MHQSKSVDPSAPFDGLIQVFNEDECRGWWMQTLHPDGPHCVGCRITITGQRSETFLAGGRIECPDCGKWFDARSETPLSGTHASWQQLYILALFRTLRNQPGCHIDRDVLSKLTGMHADTCDRINRRLMDLGL